jgi:hypothetical protein
MAAPVYTINPPFENYFYYKTGINSGLPLTGGKVYFMSNANRNWPAGGLDTYSNIGDPNSPVINTNPIVLDAVGSFPTAFLLNQTYFVAVYDQYGIEGGNLITSFENVQGSAFTGGGGIIPIPGAGNNNLIADGQFGFPIAFNISSKDPTQGQVTNTTTNFSAGWTFYVDDVASNRIYPQDISAQQIEANPQNQIVVDSTGHAGETQKDIYAVYGGANYFQGNDFTFSFQAINLASGTSTLEAFVYQNFGDKGSPDVYTSLGTFTVTQARQKFATTSVFPSTVNKIIGQNNYASVFIRFPLASSCRIGVTNCLLQLGSNSTPVYYEDSDSVEKAQILGAITDLSTLGQLVDYFPMTYQDGYVYPLTNTGEIVTRSTINPPPNGIKLDGSTHTYLASGSTNGIPNIRLYNALGATTDGSLLATSNAATVTVTSVYGFPEFSTYAAGTAPVTITKTKQQLACGLSCALGSIPTQVVMTFNDNFAPNPVSPRSGPSSPQPTSSPIGSYFIHKLPNPLALTVNDFGSGISKAQCTINFNSLSIPDYMTVNNTNGPTGIQLNFFELCSISSNGPRGYYHNPSDGSPNLSPISILFSVNGTIGASLGGTQYSTTVPFLTSKTLPQNVITFIQAVANPFIYTILFTGIPTAGQYLSISDKTQTITPWFKVGGSGTAPVGLPNPVEVDIPGTGNTTASVATALAAAIDALEFTIPITACPYIAPFADYILQ